MSGGCKRAEQDDKTASEDKDKAKDKTAKRDTPVEADAAVEAVPGGALVETVVVEERLVRAQSQALAAKAVEHGRRVATQIDAALAALTSERLDDAKAELAKASEELSKLGAERPIVDVAVELWRGHQQLEVAELEQGVDTMALLAALTRVDFPVYARETVQARQAQRQAAGGESVDKQDKSNDLALVDSKLVYLEIDMPLTATRLAVDDAKRSLDEGQPDQAKLALERAVGSLDVFAFVTEAPEYRARMLVWAAENAFTSGDISEAQHLLDEAADMLQPLAKQQEDDDARVMAAMLLTEMQPLQAALHSGAPEQLSGFDRVARNISSFSRRAALQTMMSRHHAAEHRELADALMWLEKAETEGVSTSTGDPAATADLARAAEALAKAKPYAPISAASNLDDLRSRAQRLAELDRAPTRDPEAIDASLRELMFELRMLTLAIGTSTVEAPAPSQPSGPV